jgi:hypothetical protein
MLTSLCTVASWIGDGPVSQVTRKLLDLRCELRGMLRNFGLKVGVRMRCG